MSWHQQGSKCAPQLGVLHMADQSAATISWLGRVSDAYSMLWKMIIRPPRDVYSLEELGPAKFRLGKRVYQRLDLQLRSPRGYLLECSHFVPSKCPEAARPCVVYLHGNCSSRLEAFDALPVLLPRDLTVLCLDLSGSGRSEGEYISLGYHEEKDLLVVLEHLRATGNVTAIGLWGRSMGAVTSILRAAEDHQLAACVLDSPFGDLKTVAEELVNRGRFKIPQFIVNMGLELIRREVRARAEFDPHELMPIKCAPKAKCPALFGVASDDSFVLPHHTQDLYNVWAGERLLRVFDGGHNGVRPAWFLEEASDFLTERLSKVNFKAERGEEREAEVADGSNGTTTASTPRNPPTLMTPGNVVVESNGSSADLSRPRMRIELSNELQKMGFGEEAAAEAACHCSNIEGAVEWLLKQTGKELGAVDMRPAGHRRLEDAVLASDGAPAASRLLRLQSTSDNLSSSSTVSEPFGEKGSLGRPGSNMIEQLRYLGFGQDVSEVAAKRCSSVEAAVEWLSSQRAIVQL
mmetsp:Transcript_142407/g.262469  ORF Transcript_142407/g.262469 Transcript_142407/m.262469 type:complete len:520 (-) Transcript_142407:193-1752(-)